MRLAIRPASPSDVPNLVEIYDGAYHGGYSACFDRYGPATPQDFWWVQSEKAVFLLEVNQRAGGLIILGKVGRELLVEEFLLHAPTAGREPDGRVKLEESTISHAHEFLVKKFQEERQDHVTLRCVESNPAGLLLARRHGFSFANALVVASGAVRPQAAPPAGYAIRRASSVDARSVARLHDEALNTPVRPEDLDTLLKHSETRVFIAEREAFPVGLALAQAKDGVGRWTVGVRDAHRHKGLGRALAQEALQFFAAKHLTPVTTYWALDAAASRFARGLGVRTERTYLYLEKQI